MLSAVSLKANNIYNFTLAIKKKLSTVITMFLELKSLCIMKRNVPYVSHPNPSRHTVSLKMPDPQTTTLGINKIEMAIGRISLG